MGHPGAIHLRAYLIPYYDVMMDNVLKVATIAGFVVLLESSIIPLLLGNAYQLALLDLRTVLLQLVTF